jgi:hypothetical protein
MLILRLVFGAARGVINTTLLAFGLVALSRQGGQTAGHRELSQLLKTPFEQDNDTDQVT